MPAHVVDGCGVVEQFPPRQSQAAITVQHVARLPNLRFEVLAGRGGLGNPVGWAFVADCERPWDWVDPADLILTSGWVIPADALGQRDFVERAARAGVSGLVVGEEPTCPPLTEEMLRTADHLSFPVMRAHHDPSWASVIRFIARANEGRDGQLLSAVMQVHDIVRVGLLTPRTSAEFMDELMSIVGCQLYLIDWELWEPLLPRTEAPPDSWGEALADGLAARGGSAAPLSIRLEMGDEAALALPVPRTDCDAYLFVDVSHGQSPRLALLQHVSAACALELAHVDAIFDRERRAGSDLLSDALQGRFAAATFAAAVAQAGIAFPCVCIAIDAPQRTIHRLGRSWAVREMPHLLTRAGRTHLLLTGYTDEYVEELKSLSTRHGFRAGVSATLRSQTDLGDGKRQALWALEAVRPGAEGVASYGDITGSFLPRTVLEAEEAVERVLGALIAYDAEHGADLVKTLETYMDCDRSPSRAAAGLFVHSQTVSYRLGRIEELTGRSLRATADISELWLALRALAVTENGSGGR